MWSFRISKSKGTELTRRRLQQVIWTITGDVAIHWWNGVKMVHAMGQEMKQLTTSKSRCDSAGKSRSGFRNLFNFSFDSVLQTLRTL